MRRQSIVVSAFILGCCLSSAASADVWMWTDPLGKTHFVDTVKPIFTWVGDDGRVYFSDTPDSDEAVAVQFVWHSRGSLSELDDEPETDVDSLRESETPEERKARLDAQRRHCEQVTQMYDAYKNAPALYRTNDDGEREYLKKYEMRRALREVDSARKSACKDVA